MREVSDGFNDAFNDKLRFHSNFVLSRVGLESRLRFRLPEAELFAKILASKPASASNHSKVVSFGLGFGFVMYFTVDWASVLAYRNFVSGFHGSTGVLIKPSFRKLVSISIYLQANLFASTR